MGLCSTSQIRGVDAPPVRASGAGVSLDGGGEVVRRETIATGWQRNERTELDREGILAQKGELAPWATRFGRGSGGVHSGSCRRCVGVGLSELRSGA